MARGSTTGEIEFSELSSLLESAGISREPDGPSRMMRDHMAVLAHMARGRWMGLASERCHTSQRAYQNSIEQVETEDYGHSISLENKSSDGMLANMVENGTPNGINLRETILNNRRPGSNEIKYSDKVGRYRIIPFRRSTAQSTGRTYPIMGAAYSASQMMSDRQAARLRSRMIAQMQENQGLTQSRSVAIDQATGKEYMRFRTANWGTPIKKSEGGPLLKPNHSAGLYAGMYRIRGNSSSQYIQFRTISEGGKASWMQGKITARNLAKDVMEYIEREAPNVIAMKMDNILKSY